MLFWTDYFEEEEKYIFYRHFNFYSKNIQDLIKISKKIYSKFRAFCINHNSISKT